MFENVPEVTGARGHARERSQSLLGKRAEGSAVEARAGRGRKEPRSGT